MTDMPTASDDWGEVMKWLSMQGHARALGDPDLLDRLQALLDTPGTFEWRHAVYDHVCDLGVLYLLDYPEKRDRVAGWIAEWCEFSGGSRPWLRMAFFHQVVDPDEVGPIKGCLRRAFEVARPDGIDAVYATRHRLDFAVEYADWAFFAEAVDAMAVIPDRSSYTDWRISSELLENLPPGTVPGEVLDRLKAELKRIRGGRRLSS